jgi:hypothetical protein
MLISAGCTSQSGIRSGTETNQPLTTTALQSNPTPPYSGPDTGIYYVSPSGDDNNPGTAQQPWKTFQHAASAVKPGSTVYLHAGTYDEEVRLETSGSDTAPVTFMSAPGEMATVKSLQFLRGVSNIRIKDFRVNGFANWGITVHGDNRNLQFSGLDISNGECGIKFTRGESGKPPAQGPVSDIIVENSKITGSKYPGIDCTPGPCNNMIFRGLEISGSGLGEGVNFGGDGIGIEKGDHITVDGCSIHDNGGDGIDLNSRDKTGNVPGIVVRNNQIFRNHEQGIKLWSGGRMERNVVWGQGINPILGCVYDCTLDVEQNTIAYNMWAPEFAHRDYAATFGYPEESGPQKPNIALTLKGNIFAFNTREEPTGIYMGPGVRLIAERDNIFYSRPDEEILAVFLQDRSITRDEVTSGGWSKLSGMGQGDLSIDPQFVAGWPDVDLHLKAGSPAAGKGAY